MEVQAKIRKIIKEQGTLRAYADVVLNDEFAIHDVRVIEGPNGFFAAMPSERDRDRWFHDICHPITNSLRAKINEKVLYAYEQAIQEMK